MAGKKKSEEVKQETKLEIYKETAPKNGALSIQRKGGD